jgi:hypothetical protein
VVTIKDKEIDMNNEIIVQNQLTLMNECFYCLQLNELCADCLEAKEARDAVIANQLVDEDMYRYNPMYTSMTKIEDEPSGHEWTGSEVVTHINPKTGDKTIRTEFFEQSSWLIDRLFNLDESMEVTRHECICSICHYTINKHAVCPNCN